MEKLKAKLKKLFKQKQGEEELGNFEAAARFAEKISELIILHKLELTDEDLTEETKTNPFTYELVSSLAWGEKSLPQRVDFTEDLSFIIAKAHFCRTLVFPDTNSIMFVGGKTDIEAARTVFCYLLRVALRLCEVELTSAFQKWLDAGGSVNLWNYRGGNESFRFSYFQGFNEQIGSRLDCQRWLLQESKEGGAMALQRVEKGVEDFMRSEFDPQEDDGSHRRHHRVMEEAFKAGSKLGEQISITENGHNAQYALDRG